MQPVCMPNALNTNGIDYIRVTCSSPLGSTTIIDEFKYEIRTGYSYANNQRVWKEYKCGNSLSARNAPACLIPMSVLAKHPYGLKDHSKVMGRVTATPRDSAAPIVTANCKSVDGDIRMRLAPKPISLTSTQTSNEATVCWNDPFYMPNKENNKINLYWVNGDNAIGSTKVEAFAKGDAQDVTDVAENCLKIDLKDGWTTFLAVASNSCSSVSSTISIQLTDCPTCHHGQDKRAFEWNKNEKHHDAEKPGNSFGGSTDAVVIDSTGK